MNYTEHGDKNGPLMFFLHRGGVSGWIWNKQVRYFSSYHCIVTDLPEQGESFKETPFSIDDSANQILDLIQEKRKDKQVIVIGFSLGAQVVIAMLSQRPNDIDYAMINSALFRPIQFATMFIKSLSIFYPLVKRKSFSKLQAKTLYIDSELFETYYQETCKMSFQTFHRIMIENMTFSIPEQFSQATANILVTVGQKEKGIMKISVVDLPKSNVNCTGHVFEDIGHGISLGKPDLLHQIVEQWLNHQQWMSSNIQLVNVK
ncbi:alpha/beta fold hydrolase [Bacillus alkalicellulosilyticus]|uniref:alpha/beta fold hydrolase n=1 Tax=Alkalihalobacterium alkalicellulosilyticum TaxID=1912214 RepID=UPI000996C358|nr:alpha/beta hydrolase [Bacillus alkalicellulosilyticus]